MCDGYILITITGYIGRSCVFPVDMPESNINQRIARVRIVDSRIAPNWVSWALQDPRRRNLLERDLTGLAYPQISLAQVQAVPLLVPSDDGQQTITATLDAGESKLQGERDALAKLRTVKNGLMDDLLTGRVHARVPEDAAA
jgi:type I restriction enzyme S subunit